MYAAVCLQEEAVEFQPMSRLETGAQLRRQELHGERRERRLLRGRQTTDGRQAVGGGVQQA